MRNTTLFSAPCLASVALLTFCSLAQGQSNLRSPMISGPIDETRLTTLTGNTRSAALNPANDAGEADASQPLDHMLLQLRRSPASDAALSAYIESLNDSTSPNFHKWLTAEELGATYGPAESDIAAVSAWLTSRGFTVNQVYPDGMAIDFSGTTGQVNEGFHTSMHRLSVRGVSHLANISDPRIPTALVGVVHGVVSLNDFRPHPMHQNLTPAHIDVHSGANTTARPGYTFGAGGGTYEAVVPGDLAVIYNFKKLFAAGYSGQGQTIAVIEDTNVYSISDWTTFRATFGLSVYKTGSFTQVHPGASCTNPGLNGDDGEAILDAEWASAGAPSAAIVLESCADTQTTFGGLIALENLLAAANPPKIVSISYGESESENGASGNAAFYSAYKSASAMGVSVFVSSGDEGAASSDADLSNATHGITVSGLASTPYNVAVGGTDFGDTSMAQNSMYWNPTNTSVYESAKSYIPEIPWNDSCASSLIAMAEGYGTTYGTGGFCNSATGEEYFLTTASGSGGPSKCATGNPTTLGVTSGSCAGYAKPSWQSLTGVPADGVRDLPDVSLFAANGVWGHYYVFCYTDPNNGGSPCTGAPDTWSGAGGTSFASPIMASIQAMVNQKTASSWGLPTSTYYALAAKQWTASGLAACSSANGASAGEGCIFYDVTRGDMDVNCTGTFNCYTPSGKYGVLSTSDTSFLPAYGTTKGWDFATGIGTPNAYNLVYDWPKP